MNKRKPNKIDEISQCIQAFGEKCRNFAKNANRTRRIEIGSILLIAATVVSISVLSQTQTQAPKDTAPETQPSEKTAEKKIEKVRLPITRTLTNTDGVSINATITSIQNGIITLTRAEDNQTFEIPVNRIPEEDQTYLRENLDLTPRKPTVLIYGYPALITQATVDLWEKHGFEVILLMGRSPRSDVREDIKTIVRTLMPNFQEYLKENIDVFWLQDHMNPAMNNAVSYGNMMNDLNIIFIGPPTATQRMSKQDYLDGKTGSQTANRTIYHQVDDFTILRHYTRQSGGRVNDYRLIERAIYRVKTLMEERERGARR